ncbi:MAG: polysulfide reductase NrfD [Ferrovum sp.]|nr:polysulfide reductase NrfD [Ferrovum sp.]
MEPHELYLEIINVVHQRPLTPLLANYSALVGMAGAIFLFWGLSRLHQSASHKAEQRLALPIAVALLIAGLTNPVLEVHQPGRVINMYLFGWNVAGTAIIKFGVILLPLFTLLCWWLAVAVLREEIGTVLKNRSPAFSRVADFLTLWVRRYDPLASHRYGKAIISTGFFLAVFAILYSGIFLMTEHGIAFWDSAFIPAVFFSSAVAAGAGGLSLMLPLGSYLTGEVMQEENPGYMTILLTASVISGALWLIWLQFMGHFGSIEVSRTLDLVNGPYRSLAWGWWFTLGVLFPIALLAIPALRQISLLRMVASVSAVIGSFAVRFTILDIGQAVPKSGAGYYQYQMPWEMFGDLILDWVYLTGWIALFWLLLPYRDHVTRTSPTPVYGKKS